MGERVDYREGRFGLIPYTTYGVRLLPITKVVLYSASAFASQELPGSTLDLRRRC
jgi:hypothetical protein